MFGCSTIPLSLCSYGLHNCCIFNTVGTFVSKHTAGLTITERKCLVRSPGLCISRLHVMEIGRTVSLRDEGLPLTIFPDFLAFGQILWSAVVLGLHVRVRAYCWLLVFLKYLFTAALKFGKAFGSHRGAEERWRWLRLLVVFALSLHHTLSFGPCTATVSGAAGHNRGEWRRRRSQGHKAGPLNRLQRPPNTHCCRVVF